MNFSLRYKCVPLMLIFCMLSPTFAQAYDAQAYQEAQSMRIIKEHLELNFDKTSHSTKKSLKDSLIKILDDFETNLSLHSEEISEDVNASEVISYLELNAAAEDNIDQSNFQLFIDSLKIKSKKFKKSKKTKFNKNATLKRAQELKLKLKDSKSKFKPKLLLQAIAYIGYVAWVYAVLLFIGNGAILSYLAAILGGSLGAFGVYIALFATLGLGLGLILLPEFIYGKLRKSKSANEINEPESPLTDYDLLKDIQTDGLPQLR